MNRDALFLVWRLILGVMVALCGLVLVTAGYDLLGIPLLLLSFVIAIPKSFELVALLVLGIAQLAIVSVIMWGPHKWFGDVSFGEWLSENWYVVGAWTLGLMYAIASMATRRDSTWKILGESYGMCEDPAKPLEDYPSAFGVMIIRDEFMPVSVHPTEVGLVIDWDFGDPLLFPWDRFKSIRVDGDTARKATIRLRRASTMPLEIQIPWQTRFDPWLPPHLSLAKQ